MQRLLLSTLLAFALLCSKAKAEILLTIDITNPANVTFTATAGHASADFDSDASTGFTRLGFLTSEANTSIDASGTLSANGMVEPYLTLFTLDYAGGLYEPGRDLNLYANADAGTQNFLTSSSAFSGSITFDLSEISSLLPAVGTTGSIQVGDGNTVGPVIGTYEVIPEPAACILVGAAGMLLIFRRRRSH